MGVQEGFGALSSNYRPSSRSLIWSETVDGIGLWTYHTVFRVAGPSSHLCTRIKLLANSRPENEGQHHD